MTVSDHYTVNHSKIIHETIENEVVIVNLENGCYYSLTKVAADIWSYTIRKAKVGEIIGQYTGSRAEIEKAIRSFLAELQGENLIIQVNAVSSPPMKAHAIPGAANTQIQKLNFSVPVLEKFTDMANLFAPYL